MFRPIFWVSVFFVLGIVSGQFFNSKIPSIGFLLFPSIIFGLTSLIFVKVQKLFWLFFLSGVFFLGQSRHWQAFTALNRNFPVGPSTLIGVVDSFPVRVRLGPAYFRVRFILKVTRRFDSVRGRQNINQRIMASVPASAGSQCRYGNELILRGEILRSGAANNPGGFDVESYLFNKGIAARFSVKEDPDILVLSEGKKTWMAAGIYKVRNRLDRMIEEKVPPPENAIVKALLLGDQNEIGFEVRDAFSKSGTAHLLAISGGNVALIASIFVCLLGLLFSRKWTCLFTVFLLINYCVLTGSSPSVLRATLMTVFFLLGPIFKRETEIITSLSWSAIFILTFDPFQLFDPGFQLSFVTVLILGMFLPGWEILKTDFFVLGRPPLLSPFRILWLDKLLGYLKISFLVSFIAWMASLPLVAFYFYLFSPVTVLANFVVVPYSALVMANGFSFLFLGSFSEWAQELLGWSTWFFARGLFLACDWFSSLPLSYIHLAPPKFIDFLIFYGLLMLGLCRARLNVSRFNFFALFLVCANILMWKGVFPASSKNLKITFLDVGHGDSAFVQFPNKGSLLIDAGAGGDWDQGRMAVAPFLWSRGVTGLDAILVTHPHFDHYGGLNYILKEFKVAKVFDNGDGKSGLYESYFKDSNVARTSLRRGDRITGIDDVKIEVLHPPAFFMKSLNMGLNDQSLVLRLSYKGIKVLMTGDAEEKALNALNLYGEKLRSQVLKVPHHGSDEKEAGKRFLGFVQPEIAVVSESEKNHFNLPSPKTVGLLRRTGAKVFQTGISGAVELTTDGSTFTVRAMLEEE